MRNTSMQRVAAGAILAASMVAATACSSSDSTESEASSPGFVSKPVIDQGEDNNPMIAEGVTISKNAYVYKSSGLGPKGINPVALQGSPESFIDTSMFNGGVLTDGVSITEAQGMNALTQIKENLEAQGLGLGDVVSMRVFLDNAPGADRADFAGFNRAYRQFFANTNMKTGDTEMVPMGTAAPKAPIERNAARPSRYAIEVGSLPVPGWLVEVEVDAVYPADKSPEK